MSAEHERRQAEIVAHWIKTDRDNATLMDAAPDMLAALRLALDALQGGPLQRANAIGKVREAIAAATGSPVVNLSANDPLAALTANPRWHLDCEVMKFGKPGKWRVWSLKGNQEHSTAIRTHGEGDTPAAAIAAAIASATGSAA